MAACQSVKCSWLIQKRVRRTPVSLYKLIFRCHGETVFQSNYIYKRVKGEFRSHWTYRVYCQTSIESTTMWCDNYGNESTIDCWMRGISFRCASKVWNKKQRYHHIWIFKDHSRSVTWCVASACTCRHLNGIGHHLFTWNNLELVYIETAG